MFSSNGCLKVIRLLVAVMFFFVGVTIYVGCVTTHHTKGAIPEEIQYGVEAQGRGDYHLAILHYTTAISLDDVGLGWEPSSYKIVPYDEKSTIYNNRGLCYRFTGDTVKAIEDFSKALFINPQNAIAYVNRGMTYMQIKKYRLAVDDFDKAIMFGINDQRLHQQRFNALKKLGEQQ